MPPRRIAPARPSSRRKVAAKPLRVYPNRIAELTKINHLTYADVADQVDAHEVTIANLSTGKQELTHKWIKRLAPVFKVRPAEIIEALPGVGLRVVRVTGALEAGAWAESHEWPYDEQYDVTVPDDPVLRTTELYAAQINGQSMNLRYPHGTVVVLSRIARGTNVHTDAGKRYHVRTTADDGSTEETIKKLVRADDGRYWLRPESDHPEHQEWIPLEGKPGTTVELMGRVHFVVQRED